MSKYISCTLHTLIYIGLTCVTVWDVWTITHTYLYDNRVTLVTWEHANDTYPFLKDMKLKINFGAPKTLFKEFWNDSSKWNKKIPTQKLKAAIADLENMEREFNESKTLSLDKRYALTEIFHVMLLMDTDAQFTMLGTNDMRKHQAEKYSFLHDLLQKRQYLLGLENATWRRLKKYIISVEPQGNIGFFTPDIFETSSAVISVSLSDILSPLASRIEAVKLGNILIGGEYNHSTNGKPDNDQGYIQLNIHGFQSELIPVPVSDMTQSTIVTLAITNIGIFDQSETTKCKDEPNFILVYGLNDNQFLTSYETNSNLRILTSEPCRTREFMEMVMVYCQCIPLAFRYDYALVSEKNLPFCSPLIYLNCTEAVAIAFSKSDRKCLPLCTQIKNQYTTTIATTSAVEFDDKYYETNDDCNYKDDCKYKASAQLYIQCKDYGMYKEKFQSTLQQYISQIGGDIGLYTGLSMLAIWKSIVFVHSLCSKFASDPTPKDDNSAKKRWRKLISLVMAHSTGKSTEGNMGRESNDNTVQMFNHSSTSCRIHESRIMGIERKVALLSSRVADMREIVDEIKRKGDRQHEMIIDILKALTSGNQRGISR